MWKAIKNMNPIPRLRAIEAIINVEPKSLLRKAIYRLEPISELRAILGMKPIHDLRVQGEPKNTANFPMKPKEDLRVAIGNLKTIYIMCVAKSIKMEESCGQHFRL